MTAPERSLILHADDFGFNAAVTRGIVASFQNGLLTSTSLLANAPAAQLALDEWKRLEQERRIGTLLSADARRGINDELSSFDLGVHLNLTQGRPLTGQRFPAELLDSAGRFLSPGRLFAKLRFGDHRWRSAIAAEWSAQIEWLIDRGFLPTHLNGHQYVEMMPVASEVVLRLARRYAVPFIRAASEPGHWRSSLRPGFRLTNCCLAFVKGHYASGWRRALDARGIRHADAFFGASHAGQIDIEMMRRFLSVARGYRLTEIALHPGMAAAASTDEELADGWHDPLRQARPAELRLLCSTDLVELLAARGFRLGRLASFTACQSQAA
ncbi:MAG TPA: ChbG/HpnK family deacetylase [Pirellulales bacterium]|nr:ChbG/HpnK family deacetylase [Pirellulales bacterium]